MMLWLNLAATLYMTGLIWFVQVVHYPLFSSVGTAGFANYEARHTSRTSLVVIGPMVIELLTAGSLVLTPAPELSRGLATALLSLVLVIWASTFFLQVPQHARLSNGFDEGSYRRLVTTNWVRTIAWTVRAGALLWVLAQGRG